MNEPRASVPGVGARVVAGDVVRHAALIRELGIPDRSDDSEEAFLLVERDGRLELRPPGEFEVPGVRARFPPDAGRAGRSRHPLLRAFGRNIQKVFDLTAGFGSDAYRLAEAGFHVEACERDAAVYALLATGWASDRASGRIPADVADRLQFRHTEGETMLRGVEGFDLGVYLDPMYPRVRRATALPKRELQVLRRLHAESVDERPLLESARARAARVVVKRAHRAEPIAPDVSFELESKLVRFDVYVNPDRMSPSAGAT